MRTIQIAPYREDCRIEGKKVIGVMDGQTFAFELPANVAMPRKKAVRETMISNFCEAIALSSRAWQVENLLNDYWNIKGGKFYEVRFQLALNRMERNRCSLRFADSMLFEEIVDAVSEWCDENEVSIDFYEDWDELIEGDEGIIWED